MRCSRGAASQGSYGCRKALSNTRTSMAYLNRDPGMCRFEIRHADATTWCWPGNKTRLLARQGRREPTASATSATPSPAGADASRTASRQRLRRVRERPRRRYGSPRGDCGARRRPCRRFRCDGRRQDDLGAWDWEGPAHDAANAAADDAARSAAERLGRARRDKVKDDAEGGRHGRSNLYDRWLDDVQGGAGGIVGGARARYV